MLVNLSNELEMNFLDKYLWTKEKNEFLPHKIFTEKLYTKDNLVLFYGDYLKINNLLDFDIILVSPKVKIKKISNLKKFFFSLITKKTKKLFQQYQLN